MRASLSLLTPFLVLFSANCTHSAIQELDTLRPSPADETSGYMTLDVVAPSLEGVDTAALDLDALSRIAVLSSDSLAAVLSLHQYPSLLYLDVWFYNGTSEALPLSPDIAVLVDGTKMQFRRLAPHEAANLFAGQIRGIPPYQPKTSYRVDTYQYGNYSSSTVTPYTDMSESMAQLGYAIGSAIRQKKNEQLANAAAVIYEQGLVEGTEVAPDASIRFGIFWLNKKSPAYPLELRILDSLRIPFENQEQ